MIFLISSLYFFYISTSFQVKIFCTFYLVLFERILFLFIFNFKSSLFNFYCPYASLRKSNCSIEIEFRLHLCKFCKNNRTKRNVCIGMHISSGEKWNYWFKKKEGTESLTISAIYLYFTIASFYDEKTSLLFLRLLPSPSKKVLIALRMRTSNIYGRKHR